MAQRASPADYWRAKMQTEVSASNPLPVQMSAPAPVTLELNSSAIIVLGLVAVVGLIGLFALLGVSNKKCG